LCARLRRIQADHFKQPFFINRKKRHERKEERKDRNGAIVPGHAVSCVSMHLKSLRISGGLEFACPSVVL
jgi:hypothetical protein